MDGSDPPAGSVSGERAPNYPIGAVDRALQLLTLFRDRSSISLSEAADHLGTSRSTAHRMLAMLVYHGYSAQDESTRSYRPGPALVQLGFGVLSHSDTLAHARSLMHRLADEVGETVHLVVLNGTRVTFVDGLESTHALRAGARIGHTLPAHATASGKALLAELEPQLLSALYPRMTLPRVTTQTLRRRDQLEADLQTVRRRGYAINREESEEGLCAVAAVLPAPNDLTTVAIAVAGPSVRLPAKRLERLGEVLVRQRRHDR